MANLSQQNTNEPGAWAQVKFKSNAPENAWSEFQKHPNIKGWWGQENGQWSGKLWYTAKDQNEANKVLDTLRQNQWVDKAEIIEGNWKYQWAA